MKDNSNDKNGKMEQIVQQIKWNISELAFSFFNNSENTLTVKAAFDCVRSTALTT